MAYRASVIDRAYVLRWTGEPVIGDVYGVLRAVTAARRSVGMPILYLAIISSDISMPKGAVRDAFAKALPAMAELCATIDILILDRDIRATLIRTFVRAMALAVPGPKMHVFGSADQIAADWKKKYGVDAAAVLARFRVFEETKVA